MFYYYSKIFWLIFNPINILIFFLLIGIIFHFFKKKIYRIIYSITLILFLFTFILPTGYYLIWNLEKSYSKPKLSNNIDGILILGSGIDVKRTYQHNQLTLNGKIERLIEPIELMKKFPNAKIVISGSGPTYGNFTITSVTKMFYSKVNLRGQTLEIFEITNSEMMKFTTFEEVQDVNG